MGHIGNTVQTAFTSFDKQTITGDGGATYTLTHSVANEREIEVFVNNVRQEPSVAYNVSGNTLTMTGNVASTDDFYVVYQGKAVQTVSHPSSSPLQATTATLSSNATIGGTLDVNGASTLTGGLKLGSGTKVLQEYSEGTWTATLDGLTTSPTTAITETGNYIKIGSLVFIDIQFQNVNTTGASGQVVITGLPFTPKRNSFNGDAMLLNFAMNTSASNTTPFLNTSNSRIEFWQSLNTSGWQSVDHTATGASRYLWLSMTYATDA